MFIQIRFIDEDKNEESHSVVDSVSADEYEDEGDHHTEEDTSTDEDDHLEAEQRKSRISTKTSWQKDHPTNNDNSNWNSSVSERSQLKGKVVVHSTFSPSEIIEAAELNRFYKMDITIDGNNIRFSQCLPFF